MSYPHSEINDMEERAQLIRTGNELLMKYNHLMEYYKILAQYVHDINPANLHAGSSIESCPSKFCKMLRETIESVRLEK